MGSEVPNVVEGVAMMDLKREGVGGILKKGCINQEQQGLNSETHMEEMASSVVHLEDLEATGLGGAGELTGPSVVPRQEQ